MSCNNYFDYLSSQSLQSHFSPFLSIWERILFDSYLEMSGDVSTFRYSSFYFVSDRFPIFPSFNFSSLHFLFSRVWELRVQPFFLAYRGSMKQHRLSLVMLNCILRGGWSLGEEYWGECSRGCLRGNLFFLFIDLNMMLWIIKYFNFPYLLDFTYIYEQRIIPKLPFFFSTCFLPSSPSKRTLTPNRHPLLPHLQETLFFCYSFKD